MGSSENVSSFAPLFLSADTILLILQGGEGLVDGRNVWYYAQKWDWGKFCFVKTCILCWKEGSKLVESTERKTTPRNSIQIRAGRKAHEGC